jgi:hypothetical protein
LLVMQLANHKNKAETLIYLEQEAFELNSVRAARKASTIVPPSLLPRSSTLAAPTLRHPRYSRFLS